VSFVSVMDVSESQPEVDADHGLGDVREGSSGGVELAQIGSFVEVAAVLEARSHKLHGSVVIRVILSKHYDPTDTAGIPP